MPDRARGERSRGRTVHLATVGDSDKADAVPERREPTTLATLTSSGAVFVWAARVVWLVVAVLGGRAVGDALAGRSRPVQVTGTVAAWAGWGAAALTLAVTGVLALTASALAGARRAGGDRRHRGRRGDGVHACSPWPRRRSSPSG